MNVNSLLIPLSHSTAKPAEVVAALILDGSVGAEAALDGFPGRGITRTGAERATLRYQGVRLWR